MMAVMAMMAVMTVMTQQAFSRHSAGGIHKQQHGRFRPRGLMDKAPPY